MVRNKRQKLKHLYSNPLFFPMFNFSPLFLPLLPPPGGQPWPPIAEAFLQPRSYQNLDMDTQRTSNQERMSQKEEESEDTGI